MRLLIAIMILGAGALACHPETGVLEPETRIQRDSITVDCEVEPAHPDCTGDGGGTVGSNH